MDILIQDVRYGLKQLWKSKGAPCVAIVNEAFTGRYFGGASPLGKHLMKHSGRSTEKQLCEIVGVIRDNDWQSMHELRPFFAMAVQQSDQRRMTLLVNATADAKNLIVPVRQVIRDLDRGARCESIR